MEIVNPAWAWIFTSHVIGKSNNFCSVRLSVCLSVCLRSTGQTFGPTDLRFCTRSKDHHILGEFEGQGHRSKIKVTKVKNIKIQFSVSLRPSVCQCVSEFPTVSCLNHLTLDPGPWPVCLFVCLLVFSRLFTFGRPIWPTPPEMFIFLLRKTRKYYLKLQLIYMKEILTCGFPDGNPVD